MPSSRSSATRSRPRAAPPGCRVGQRPLDRIQPETKPADLTEECVVIDAMQPKGIVRRRGYEEDEELDLNAAVRATIDIRRGINPDPRINIRITRHIRDLSIVLLLDLSESTNEKIGDIAEVEEGYEDQPSILDLTRESAGLPSWATTMMPSLAWPVCRVGFRPAWVPHYGTPGII